VKKLLILLVVGMLLSGMAGCRSCGCGCLDPWGSSQCAAPAPVQPVSVSQPYVVSAPCAVSAPCSAPCAAPCGACGPVAPCNVAPMITPNPVPVR
jgi:hypothetical protein